MFLITMGAWLCNLYNVLTIFLQACDIYFKLAVWEIKIRAILDSIICGLFVCF